MAFRTVSAVAIGLTLAACTQAPSSAQIQTQTQIQTQAQAGPAPAAAPALTMEQRWRTPTDPFRIADNVYYVGTLGLGAFLFTSDEGHVLLDGALPQSAPEILSNIRELGFNPKDVRYLLNSHAHFDHSGGLAELKRETGARLVAHEGDVSALEGGFYLGSERLASFQAPPVKVDLVIEDGYVLELGPIRLVAHHTPGHSRGCTSWGATVRDGDESHEALVFCSATVAANRITPPLQYPGIVEDYRRTFAVARTLKVDLPLAPHPEFFSLLEKNDKAKAGAAHAFVDREAFGKLIAQLEADFEKALAERTAAAKAAN